VHQPLHAGDDHDAGGNAKTVKTRSGPKGKLHHYWDTEFIRKLGTGSTDVAGKLIGKISVPQRKAWAQGTTAQWAMESYAVATERAYGALPKPKGGVYLLGPSYEAHAVDAVSAQLGKAGVRLAEVLNRALADTH
jgi:S1/P1 Nuclease